MPNPKTGTVTDDTASAIAAVKAGRIDFKVDKSANLGVAIGKIGFEASQLLDNCNAVLDTVVAARPASAKGAYISSITLTPSMSPGVSIDPAPYIS